MTFFLSRVISPLSIARTTPSIQNELQRTVTVVAADVRLECITDLFRQTHKVYEYVRPVIEFSPSIRPDVPRATVNGLNQPLLFVAPSPSTLLLYHRPSRYLYSNSHARAASSLQSLGCILDDEPTFVRWDSLLGYLRVVIRNRGVHVKIKNKNSTSTVACMLSTTVYSYTACGTVRDMLMLAKNALHSNSKLFPLKKVGAILKAYGAPTGLREQARAYYYGGP